MRGKAEMETSAPMKAKGGDGCDERCESRKGKAAAEEGRKTSKREGGGTLTKL